MIQKLEQSVIGTNYGCGGASFSEVIDKVNEVIDYINSLPEETNEAASTMAPSCWGEEQDEVGLVNGLEEEVKRYYSDNFTYISSDQPTLSILTNVARHFAEWQKEQMTKEAVNYKIVNNLAAYPVIYYEVKHLGLKFGDKVKLIIVKED